MEIKVKYVWSIKNEETDHIQYSMSAGTFTRTQKEKAEQENG